MRQPHHRADLAGHRHRRDRRHLDVRGNPLPPVRRLPRRHRHPDRRCGNYRRRHRRDVHPGLGRDVRRYHRDAARPDEPVGRQWHRRDGAACCPE